MIRLFGIHLDVSVVVLAAIEIVSLYFLSIGLNAALRWLGLSMGEYDAQVLAALVALATLVGLTACGLYNREHFLHWDDALSRAMVVIPALAVAFLLLITVFDQLMMVEDSHPNGPYALCVLSVLGFLPLFMALRRGFLHLVDRTGTFTRRILILGSGNQAARIEELCGRDYDRSFTVVGYVHLGAKPFDEPGAFANCRRAGPRRIDFWVKPHDLADLCAQHRIEELVVATRERRGLPVRELLACKLSGITMTEFATFWERETRQIPLDAITPSWLLFSDGFRVGLLRSAVKRAFDIATSLVLLTLSLPVTVLTALLIKLESPGPIFYRQERVGLGGRSYNILKFRSMRTDAEKEGPRWAAKNDSRVTRVGAVIRKIRIDEIPQVINVLRGEMAFVGPRPERPVFVSALAEKIPYYMERHSIKPGITGWAQINYPYGANEEDARMKLSFDLYYAKNGNIFLDILIIIQTIKVLIWSAGAR